MKTALCTASAALVLAGCIPAVEMPGVFDPLTDPGWKRCAEELAVRQEQAMLDDLMLDSQRLICEAVVLGAEGRTDESMSMFSKAAAKDEEDHRPHYLAGRILSEAGRYDEALTEFERSHKRYPTLKVPAERLGRSIKKEKGAEEAAAFMERAVKRKLCDYGCKSLLAQTYHELDKDVFAKPVYEQMAAEEPWEPGAFVGLASLSNAEGDFAKEVFYLEKAAATKKFKELGVKQQAGIYYSTAFAKYNAGDYDGAASSIAEGVRLNPERADWLFLSGRIELKRNRPEAALTAFEAAEKIDPNLAAIHEGIGDVRTTLGDIPAARVAYNKAHQIEPADALFTLKLAHAAALDKDYDIAKRLYKEALSLAGAAGLPEDLVDTVSDLLSKRKKK